MGSVAAGQRFPSFPGAFALGDAADGHAGVLVEEVEPAGVHGQLHGPADPGLGLGVDPGGPQPMALPGQLLGLDLVFGRLVEAGDHDVVMDRGAAMWKIRLTSEPSSSVTATSPLTLGQSLGAKAPSSMLEGRSPTISCLSK